MKKQSYQKYLILAVIILSVFLIVSGFLKGCRKDEEVTPAEQNLIQTVEKAIQDPNKPGHVRIPANVKVLSLNIEGDLITVNYSKEILANGTGGELEDILGYLSTMIDTEIFGDSGIQEYENLKKERGQSTLIEGKPLKDYLQK